MYTPKFKPPLKQNQKGKRKALKRWSFVNVVEMYSCDWTDEERERFMNSDAGQECLKRLREE